MEISWLLADEMRARVKRWAEIIVHACGEQSASGDDLRAALRLYAERDRAWIASMMTTKYRWLKLKDSDIDFAMTNEIDQQVGAAIATLSTQGSRRSPAALNPANWPWWQIAIGLITIAAGAAAIVQHFA